MTVAPSLVCIWAVLQKHKTANIYMFVEVRDKGIMRMYLIVSSNIIFAYKEPDTSESFTNTWTFFFQGCVVRMRVVTVMRIYGFPGVTV